MTNAEGLLREWLHFGRSFSGPLGAIIAHGPECRFYALLQHGENPKDKDCTCKASYGAKLLLQLVRDTKAELGEKD